MAQGIQSLNNSPARELTSLIRTWETRWRLSRVIWWLPRIWAIALLLFIGVGLYGRTFGVLSQVETIALFVGTAIVSTAGVFAWYFVRQRSPVEAAQQFDVLFDMQERVSTALELDSGRIGSVDEITHVQIADATAQARDIDPAFFIKFETRPFDWLFMVIFLFAAIILMVLPTSANAGTTGITAQAQTAIEDATEELRDLTEEIATNTALTAEDRESLLETIETSLDELQNEEVTEESAFAAMSEVEQDLRELADSLSEETETTNDAFSSAAESLREFTDNDAPPNDGTTSEVGEFSEEMEAIQEALENLSPEQQQALQEALQEAANTQNLDPQTAQSLADMAASLQDGEIEAANMDATQLQEALEQLQEQQQQQSELSDDLNDSADDAESSADDIANSESSNEQGDQNQQQGEQQQQQGDQPPGQEAPQQQQDDGQSGDAGPGAQGSESDQNSQQQDAGAQTTGENESPQQSDQSANVSGDAQGNPADGAGDSSSQVNQDGQDSSQSGSGQDNQGDGQGLSEFETVFVPEGIEAQGQSNIVLEPDASDAPIIEGDFQENPEGTSIVTYTEVFSNYSDAATRALDSDYVPLGLRDVVRDYFTSLAPADGDE